MNDLDILSIERLNHVLCSLFSGITLCRGISQVDDVSWEISESSRLVNRVDRVDAEIRQLRKGNRRRRSTVDRRGRLRGMIHYRCKIISVSKWLIFIGLSNTDEVKARLVNKDNMDLEQRMTLKRDSSVPNFFSPASNSALASLRALRRSIVLPSGRLACNSATRRRFKLPDVSETIDSSSFLPCPANNAIFWW